MWTDSTAAVGTIAFLIRSHHLTKRWERRHLSNRPQHTNMSHQPRLRGWCGTTDDISRSAEGVCVVTRTTGTRALVRRIPQGSAEEREALETLGWTELAPEVSSRTARRYDLHAGAGEVTLHWTVIATSSDDAIAMSREMLAQTGTLPQLRISLGTNIKAQAV